MLTNQISFKPLIAALLIITIFSSGLAAQNKAVTPGARDTTYVEVDFEGRRVAVQLPYLIGKQMTSSPCTYLLTDSTVVYGECNSGHEYRLGDRIWARISCRKPGRVYYEKFEGASDYLLQHAAPLMKAEARPIPYRIDYYNSDYTVLKSIFDLRADNPYTKEKMPRINLEQYFDSELGFGSPAAGDETAQLHTYTSPFFFDDNYTGITYRLFRYNARLALLGVTTTITILDTTGKVRYKMSDLDMDITPVLITKDGNYLATQLNTLIDQQDYPHRLGNPGIRIWDMRTGKVVFEEINSNLTGYFSGPFQRDSHLLFFLMRDNMYDNSTNTYIFLDMEVQTRYAATFTKAQIESGVVSWSNSWEKIIDSKLFTSSKF